MRRLSLGLIIGACLWVLAVLTPKVSYVPPVRIMPLGDSLTEGPATLPFFGGYRDRLHELLTVAGFNADFVGTQDDERGLSPVVRHHEGHGGYRIDQLDAGIERWLGAVADPDVVLLLAGTNDFWQNFQTASSLPRLERLVVKVANLRPWTRILLASLPPRRDRAELEAAQVTFNASIRQLVDAQRRAGLHVYFVDLHGAMNVTQLSTDGVHPDSAGSECIARAWFAAITQVISPLGTSDPPMMVRASSVDPQHVAVSFSQPLEDAAIDLKNFVVSGDLSVLEVQIDTVSRRIISLTTSPQTAGTWYTVVVSGVRDRTAAHLEIPAGSTITFQSPYVVNGRFESGYRGWRMSGNQEVVGVSSMYQATDGARAADFNGGDTTPDGVLEQTFSTSVPLRNGPGLGS